MKMTVISVEIDVLGTIPKGSVKGLEDLEIRGRVETIQIIALLRSVSLQRRVLESRGDLLYLTQTPVKDHQLALLWKTLKE